MKGPGETSEWLTVVEGRQLKAFDDPEVLALASRYGDSALLFRYEWVPAVPGINASGDDERDYAALEVDREGMASDSERRLRQLRRRRRGRCSWR